MRVALVSQEFPPFQHGGAGTYVAELAHALTEAGVHVHVFTIAEAARNANFVVPVSSQSSRAFGYWKNLPRALQEARRHYGPFDVVHASSIADLPLARWGDSSARVVTVHHVTRTLVRSTKPSLIQRLRDIRGEYGLVPFVEGHLMRRADRVIAVSKQTAADAITYCGVQSDRLQVIYNGITSRSEIEAVSVETVLNSYCRPNQALIVSIGRLEHRKGTDILLRAFAQIDQEQTPSRLLLAGGEPTSEHLALVNDLKIEKNVTFLGRVSADLRDKLYASCDVFVLASRFEGFGFVPLEAMTFGKPIVMTRTGIAADGVINNDHGAIAPVEDPEALAKGIVNLLQNKVRRIEIGQANKHWVETHFSWQAAAQATIHAYEQAMHICDMRRKYRFAPNHD